MDVNDGKYWILLIASMGVGSWTAYGCYLVLRWIS